jgi:surface antigen
LLRHISIISAVMLAAGAANADVLKFEKGALQRATSPIGSVDHRQWLTIENGEKLGLSAAEVTRIWRSTGFVICDSGAGSAALVFDNRHIITAAHLLIERDDPYKAFRKNCVFYAHDPNKSYVRHPLILNPDTAILGTRNTASYPNEDWAIVKLQVPVAGGIPFAIGDERVAKAGNQVFAISSDQIDKPNPFHPDNPGLPMAQKCEIREVEWRPYSHNFKSECDLHSGASGGVSIMRLDGELTLVGINVRSGRLPDAPRGTTESIVVTGEIPVAVFQLGAGAIRASTRGNNGLLAGDIGDELDDSARLVAQRTEISALNDLMSSGIVRWKSGAVSGFVVPLLHDGPPEMSSNCRSFVHAIVYGPARTKAVKGKACRAKNGRWVLSKSG